MQIVCTSKGAKLWKCEPYWGEIQAMAKNVHQRVNGCVLIVRRESPLLAVNPFTSKAVPVRPVGSIPEDTRRYNGVDWLAGLIFLGYEPIN
jgi:hypothetical protein